MTEIRTMGSKNTRGGELMKQALAAIAALAAVGGVIAAVLHTRKDRC